MAIAFVNGTNNAGSAVTSLNTPYAPTAGNTVCVFLCFSGAVTNLTVTDQIGNPLTAGPTKSNTVVVTSFYYTAASGVTQFQASWTTSRQVSCTIVEYSGVIGGVNAGLAGNTASASSATASITVTTDDATDWVTAMLAASGQVITITVGNSRETNNIQGAKVVSADATASASSATITGTLTSTAWAIVLLELRNVQTSGGGSTSNWLSKAVATGVNKHS
jgi:hypothetical protein